MQKLSILILIFLISLIGLAHVVGQEKQAGDSETSAFEVDSIVLLNPMEEFGQRTGSVKVVAGYIKIIKAAFGKIADTAYADDKTPHNGLIAVAVRPNGTSKFWVDIGDESQEELATKLQQAMPESGTPQVTGGPIAFMLNIKIWGGVEKPKTEKDSAVQQPSMPIQWNEALGDNEKPLQIPDGLLPLVWPVDDSENDAHEETTLVPEGFVLQSLDPLGGSVLRPKDWHFSRSGSNQGIVWTISKEPLKPGYTTGVRIQLFVGIKKMTGQTPEEFMQKFLDSKRKGFKVLSEREAIQQGEFTRVGLETEEPQPGTNEEDKPFRILYSCFWNNKTDMAAITISGTTTDLWEEHRQTFDTMAGITLVDLKKAKPEKQEPENHN